ncbi:MAG: hypothetical protein J6J81_00865 [Oscillospiraceae bacterium]|nr:hypothetical protein [Oscillospiraceae bacterium]
MLSRLFQQLFASAGVVFRTIRAFFTRALSGVIARVKSATSLTRQAAKLAPAMMKTAAAAGKKPSKREDYIETRQMLISKSFLIMAAVVIVVAAALFWFVGRPWLVSRFFTAELWHQDPEAADYSGKVILYYEKEKDTVLFEGRLEEGVIQGRGSAFDENGRPVYAGDYVDGLYHGEGKLYIDGALTYVGSFADGLYEGEGRLYGEGEALVYEGGFSSGLRSGEGTAYEMERSATGEALSRTPTAAWAPCTTGREALGMRESFWTGPMTATGRCPCPEGSPWRRPFRGARCWGTPGALSAASCTTRAD